MATTLSSLQSSGAGGSSSRTPTPLARRVRRTRARATAAAALASPTKEVTWALPDGFVLWGRSPTYEASTRGSLRVRSSTCGGRATGAWQLGKIYEIITTATPRLAKKFNFRVAWADNNKGPASLTAANYASGADAALDSCVILKKANKD